MMAQKVQIFYDYVCPYCFIATGMIEELRKDHDLDVEWIPFQLNEDAPEEGFKMSDQFPDVDIAKYYGELNETIKPYGLSIIGKDHLTNTRKAHLATLYARDHGKDQEFHLAVHKAHFTDGLNISSDEVLKKIGEEAGLNSQDMMAAVYDGRYDDRLEAAKADSEKRAIDVVPTYFFDTIRVEGAVPIDELKSVLESKKE